MKDDCERIEAELTKLVPRRLSRGAVDKIGKELGNPRHPGQSGRAKATGISWAPVMLKIAAVLAVLAAVSVAILLHVCKSQPGDLPSRVAEKTRPTNGDVFRPIVMSTALVDERDEGLVFSGRLPPVRRVRYHLVDHMKWRNARRGVTFSSTRPREEVILVSLEMD